MKARTFNSNGEEFVVEGDGITALALVHEIGHLNGELFIDFVEGDLWEVES